MEKKWPPWLDHLNDFDGKIATLSGRERGWWGDTLIWEVDGKYVTTDTNSSYEFRDAEPGVKAIIHFQTAGNFWVAKRIEDNA